MAAKFLLAAKYGFATTYLCESLAQFYQTHYINTWMKFSCIRKEYEMLHCKKLDDFNRDFIDNRDTNAIYCG